MSAQAINTASSESVHAAVSEYYAGLSATSDLKTSACMIADEVTGDVAAALRNVHPEILDRFYGCGSPIPPLLTSTTVLDLGCGTGRDVYVASQFVGAGGMVIGVDMTREQLDVAEKHEQYHAQKFGFAKPNTLFLEGQIEDLKRAGVKDNSVDVVVSNCVLNLAANKLAVFKEIFRVLKPGGELYFSDVYASARIPEEAQKDKVLYGECLSGALYKQDFARMMKQSGFGVYFTTSSRVISLDDPAIRAKLPGVTFYSETIRAFKIAGNAGSGTGTGNGAQSLEDTSEDYGQTATYRGNIAGFPYAWSLGMGAGLTFVTGQRTPVDGNTATVLQSSRYASAFQFGPTHVKGARQAHRGSFTPSLACVRPVKASTGSVAAAALEGDEEDGPAAACCPPKSGGKSSCC
jgi:arsenite methyltransferase